MAYQSIHSSDHLAQPSNFNNVPQLRELHEQLIIVHLLAEGPDEYRVSFGPKSFQHHSTAHGLRHHHSAGQE